MAAEYKSIPSPSGRVKKAHIYIAIQRQAEIKGSKYY